MILIISLPKREALPGAPPELKQHCLPTNRTREEALSALGTRTFPVNPLDTAEGLICV